MNVNLFRRIGASLKVNLCYICNGSDRKCDFVKCKHSKLKGHNQSKEASDDQLFDEDFQEELSFVNSRRPDRRLMEQYLELFKDDSSISQFPDSHLAKRSCPSREASSENVKIKKVKEAKKQSNQIVFGYVDSSEEEVSFNV